MLRLDCLVPACDDERFTVFLSENVPWGWEIGQVEGGLVRFIVYLDTEHATEALVATITRHWPRVEHAVSPFEDQDWSESWKEFFEPVPVGETFLVLPSWRRDEKDLGGPIPLYIEPKMAFGTGHHATTALCLEAVARLHAGRAITRGTRFLDLGTGSGILALACARLGLSGLGLDIDPAAVDNARENLLLNQLQGQVEIRRGGLNILERGQRFGLILANILAGALARMAPDLVARLAPEGCLVLSGILVDQAARVKAAYQEQGLDEPQTLLHDEWTALVWRPCHAVAHQ